MNTASYMQFDISHVSQQRILKGLRKAESIRWLAFLLVWFFFPGLLSFFHKQICHRSLWWWSLVRAAGIVILFQGMVLSFHGRNFLNIPIILQQVIMAECSMTKSQSTFLNSYRVSCLFTEYQWFFVYTCYSKL